MDYYSVEESFNVNGTYAQYPFHCGSQYAQYSSSSVDASLTIEQRECSIQDSIPPAPSDFLNCDDSFITSFLPSSSLAQASATFPIQNGFSDMLPHSYLDIFANTSGTLPVAAPVPIPHVTRTKAALRTMLSFDDKGSVYRIPLTRINWYERRLQDKEDIHNNNPDSAAAGGELSEFAYARTQVDLDNYVLHPTHIQTAMDYNVLANTGNNYSKQTTTAAGRSNLAIRSISPSTLMALTEPCLMAWCTAIDENVAEPASSGDFPLQSLDHNNYVDTRSNPGYQTWGY